MVAARFSYYLFLIRSVRGVQIVEIQKKKLEEFIAAILQSRRNKIAKISQLFCRRCS
jgi:hypothetical protein